MMLFLHLQIRLETNKCIPSIFELDKTGSITTLFLCDDPIDLSPNYQNQCCVRRKNLLLIVIHLAKLRLIHLADESLKRVLRGCNIKQLITTSLFVGFNRIGWISF